MNWGVGMDVLGSGTLKFQNRVGSGVLKGLQCLNNYDGWLEC
jgi:hypothetical protein